MRYINTSHNCVTDFKGAVMNVVSPDGSLFLPESIPVIPKALFNNIEAMSLKEIAYVVVSELLGSDLSHSDIKNIVDRTFTFPLPYVDLDSATRIMELFHGPTMAFKDISTRFIVEYFACTHKSTSRQFVGVAATTGNTGVAIADAFRSHPDLKSVVLFPRGFLNRMRRIAVAHAGKNIYPVEVEGTIAQCKQLIQQAVADPEIASRMMLVCTNTKNYLRIVPQVAVFFYAYARLKAEDRAGDGMDVTIPSACLSNAVAAVIAKRLGLPIGHIYLGTNSNDDIERVLAGQLPFDRVHATSRTTLAKAMDAGYPTNLGRLLDLYRCNLDALRADITAVAITDEEIAETVNSTIDRFGYMPDPHTAVAICAMGKNKLPPDRVNIVMATAHPSKSLADMTTITGRAVELPLQMTRFMASGHPGDSVARIAPTYPAFRKFLLNLK